MKQRIRWRSWGLAGFRALLLIAIFACFHRAASRSWSVVNPTDKLLTLAQVLPYFPSATSISQDSSSLWQKVLDHNDDTLGTVIQTSPESDSIIGFSGSSNTLVAFDKEGTVMNLVILTSGDTDDHVDQVRENARFMSAITGKSWEDLAQISGIEGVSGATLTSQAVLESIIRRTGGSTPSLRFPTSITLSEAQDFFPQAATLETESRAFLAVKDSIGTPLGYVARSSPHSDSVIGYQGPTDTFGCLSILTSTSSVVRPRKSFDTKNYLKSIEIDDYFLKSFNGQTLETLATLDLLEAGIEGVSGATMTSMTMADGVLAMAQAPEARTYSFRGLLVAQGLAASVWDHCHHALRRRDGCVAPTRCALGAGDVPSTAYWLPRLPQWTPDFASATRGLGLTRPSLASRTWLGVSDHSRLCGAAGLG